MYYDIIELTPQEVEAALLEARKKKYFHEKHKSYWEEQEKNKVKSSRLNTRST